MRVGKAPRVLGKRFNLPGLVEEGEYLARQSFSGQFRFRDQPSGLRIRHGLCVAQLVAVRGASERDENRRSARRGYFRGSDRSAQAKRSAMFVRKGTTSARISRRAYAVLTAL